MSSNRLDLIKKLRAMTHAGFSLCTEALQATKNNLEEAVRWLRQRGMAKAQKKVDRVAGESKTGFCLFENRAVLYQLRCETDFVARNQDFIKFFELLGTALLNSKITAANEANQVQVAGQPLPEAILELISRLGEKIELGKVKIFIKKSTEIFGSYDHHGGKSSAIVVLSGTNNQALADDIAMHVVAMRPQFINLEMIDAEYRAKEKASIVEAERFSDQEQDPALQARIIEGKLKKQLSEITLLEQKNIHNEKKTIAQTLASENAKITEMEWLIKEE